MHCVGLLFEEIRKNLHMSILVLVDKKEIGALPTLLHILPLK